MNSSSYAWVQLGRLSHYMLSVAHRWLTPVNPNGEAVKLKHQTNDNKNIQQEIVNVSSLQLLYWIVGLTINAPNV